MIVAIDGPSGAGKSTLAKRLARDLGFMYLDTGAMYRALALKILRRGLDLDNHAKLAALIDSTEIDLVESSGNLKVLLDGADVSESIRTPEVSQMASKVSALAVVRSRRAALTSGGSPGEGRAAGRRGRDCGRWRA